MRVVVMDEITEDSGLRRAWNQLAMKTESPEVFYTYEWAIAVQRAYRGSLTPLVVLGYEGDSLAGVAALARRPSGEVVSMTADTGDYCDFLTAPEARQGFVVAVFGELRKRGITKIVFTNLPADSATATAVSSAAKRSGFHLHLRPAYACARVVLGSEEQRAGVKQTVLAKKRLRRNMREMQKRGSVTIQHATDWEEIEPLLGPFSRGHITRFLETGKFSNQIRAERRAFLSDLAKELSSSRAIVLSRLLVGDVIAAWNYGFRFAGSWFWYQPTVSRIYGDFSPGYCLLAKIIETACDSPELNVVDLGLGAEGYKERFATESRPTLYCELNASVGNHLYAQARYRASAMATASPRVEKWIRSAMARVSTLRARLSSRSPGSLLPHVVRRAWNAVFSIENVFFYRWPGLARQDETSSMRLCPLDSDLIGNGAIMHADDPDTLRFLMRSAQRLESGEGNGFALVTDEGIPVHFCWARAFEGFHMAELSRKLHAPEKDAVMIFDCFTPASARGHGFFSEAIIRLAEQIHSQGRSAWIFGAETNHASVTGIEKTPFRYKFSLGRKKILFLESEKDSIPLSEPTESEKGSATALSCDKVNERS